jgi:hypothetical protein
VRIINAYRTRAIGFEKLAKRTGDANTKQRLYDLSRACAAVAEAIERNPEFAEIEEHEQATTLH